MAEVTAAAPVSPAVPAPVVMTREVAAQLRAPFDEKHLGLLPKVLCRACSNSPSRVCEDPRHAKTKCLECGNWMTTAHMHLTYAGHAEVTSRLIAVDPLWDWEPMSLTPEGLPRFDEFGGLWIRLTIAGVPKLGYGDAEGKRRGPTAVKEAIGDAIRNAAMRFGVGLDLWGATFTEDDDPALVAERRAAAEQAAAAGGAPAGPPTTTATRPLPAREPWDNPDPSQASAAGSPPAEQPAPATAPPARQGPSPDQVFETGVKAITAAKSLAQLDELAKLIDDFDSKHQITSGQAGRLRLKLAGRRDELAAEVPPQSGPPRTEHVTEPDGAVIGASA
jgi:hypothetical protein